MATDLIQAPGKASRKDTHDCPQCGSCAILFRTSGDINRRITRETFNYFRCDACGLVFLQNVPADLGLYYRHGYQSIPDGVQQLRKRAAKEKYRLNELVKIKDRGQLLEIGPWIGMFSINAKDAGFEVEAIESDALCVDFLRNQLGIRVFPSRDPAAILGGLRERYDAIVLWHSLEHLPTPWLVIERAATALKAGGVLLVAIPNIDSYDSRIMREQWVHLDAPRHLYFYSAGDLSALCKRFGLLPVHISIKDRLSRTLSAQAWYRYLRRSTPFEYLRAAAGLRKEVGSGFTAIFRKAD